MFACRTYFEAHVKDLIPELLFFVGDVRTDNGMSEGAEKITAKVVNTLHALRRIISFPEVSDSDSFLSCQEGDTDGDRELLEKIQKVALDDVGLKDIEILEALLACLTYENLGKISLWREQLHEEIEGDFVDSISDVRVIFKALSNKSCHSRFLPSFTTLPLVAQKFIEKAFEADFIFGQFGQLECVPGSLVKLSAVASEGPSNSNKYNGRKSLYFGLFMQLLGISGHQGGQLPKSLWGAFYDSIQALSGLADGQTPIEVYDSFVQNKKESLGVVAQVEQNTDRLQSIFEMVKREDYESMEAFSQSFQKSIVRLALALRYVKPSQLSPLIGAALELGSKDLVNLVLELNRNGINDGWAILLMFGPNLLQTVVKDAPESEVQRRLLLGLKTLNMLYKSARKELNWKFQVGETGNLNRGSDTASGVNSEVSHEISATGDLPREAASATNGVYEVNCYQVATWAGNIDTLEHIVNKNKKAIVLEHSFINGSLGEAKFRVDI